MQSHTGGDVAADVIEPPFKSESDVPNFTSAEHWCH
jgi:hypothetical protein